MSDLVNMVYVEGNLLLSMVNLMFLLFAFDCLIAFGSCIKSIKGAVS